MKIFEYKQYLTLAIIIIFSHLTLQSKSKNQPNDNKPYLWVYWENLNRTSTPAHIALCRQTLLKHCSKSFNIVELNEISIHKYLPELKKYENLFDLNRLHIAQRVDFYRVLLLQKYGGLYIDADMIILKDLKEMVDKLTTYDYVGAGHYEYNEKADSNKSTPQNWLMISRPNGIFINKLLEKMISILRMKHKRLRYHALGKYLLRDTLEPLLKSGYTYFHYNNDYDGTKDINGKFISTERIFSSDPIEYKDIKNLFFIAMSNWHVNKLDLNKLTVDELLALDLNFSRLIMYSLSI